MSAQQSQEVQLLLAAEKRASEKISEARKRKVRRLKQAKEEASLEIENFKAERQRTFAKYEEEHMGSKGDEEKKIQDDTNQKIELMSQRIDSTKRVVLDTLIEEVVTNINPQLHRNFKNRVKA